MSLVGRSHFYRTANIAVRSSFGLQVAMRTISATEFLGRNLKKLKRRAGSPSPVRLGHKIVKRSLARPRGGGLLHAGDSARFRARGHAETRPAERREEYLLH